MGVDGIPDPECPLGDGCPPRSPSDAAALAGCGPVGVSLTGDGPTAGQEHRGVSWMVVNIRRLPVSPEEKLDCEIRIRADAENHPPGF